MKKQNNIHMLTYLYVRLAINKFSIISISITYVILIAYLLFTTCLQYDDQTYMIAYEGIHLAYIRESSFVMTILNSIILVVFINIIMVDSSGFDSIYVPINKRGNVIKAKILALMILSFIIGTISFCLVIAAAEFCFINFLSTRRIIFLLFFNYISSLLQLGLSLLLLSFISNNFISMSGFFITFLMLFISSNFSQYEEISYFIPVLNEKNELINIPYFGISISILSILIYVLRYDSKNIN